MKKEIVYTGGLKEFHITKDDRNRWGSEDTESTKEFKNELNFWREHPYRYWWRQNKDKILVSIIIIIPLALFLKYFY